MRVVFYPILFVFALLLWLPALLAEARSKPIAYPDITDTSLPNGLRVLLMEHHEQPTVTFHLVVTAGNIDDPLEKIGLSELTSNLLMEGTMDRSGEEIVKTINLIGGRLNASSGWFHSHITCTALTPHVDIAFDLLADIVLNPVFPKEAVERIRRRMVTAAVLATNNVHFLARKNSQYLLFGSQHPFGREATPKSLDAIGTDDIGSFYQTRFAPNNAVLLVAGDFSRERMLNRLAKRFKSWKPKRKTERLTVSPDNENNGRFRVIHKPGLTQAVIEMSQWAIETGNPDYHAYRLMNYILGGGSFSSRLMQVVRSKMGKTYGIDSRYFGNPEFGVFGISTSTRNDEVLNTVRLIRGELKKIVEKGVTQTELQKAKSYFAGSIPLRLESPDSIAGIVLSGLLNGFTMDELKNEIVHIEAVTLADVNRTLRKHLSPDQMNLVIVCDADKVEHLLKDIGTYETVDYEDPLIEESFF